MVQTPSPPLSGGIWRGRQNTGPLSDSRLQLLQEQLEESQRELAKAKAEAAPSDYGQLPIEAVRNIYIDPEQVDVQPVELEVRQLPNDSPKDDGGESSEHNALDLIMKQIMPRQDEEVDSEAVDEAAKEEAIQQKQLKLKNEHEKKKAAQDVLEAVDMRRPLRLSAVGVVQPRSTRDKKFIKLARVNDFEIVYL